MAVKIAIIYYSATGNTYRLAKAMESEAQSAGAEVRLRKVKETLPPDIVQKKPDWAKHLEETKDVPEASGEDLVWAQGLAFGSPTRYGNMTAQMKAFVDSTGGLWAKGQLADKTVTLFTGAQNPHGGQESTLLSMSIVFHHWGCILVPPGYTDKSIFAAGGNPYGTSLTARTDGKLDESSERAGRHQIRRLTEITRKLTGA